MQDKNSLSHKKWECKYHIVWILKYRGKKTLRRNKRIFRERYAIGARFLKEKNAIYIARTDKKLHGREFLGE